MRISTLLYEQGIKNYIDSETIGKLLLCYYRNICDNLTKLCNLEERNELYIDEYLESCDILSIKEKYNINNKKFNLIQQIFNKENPNEYCYVENYIFPDDVSDVTGPFIQDKNIIFYNTKNKILIVFTFKPLNYSMKNQKDYKSDINVRDLNCYIIDNVSKENFETYIETRVSGTIDYIQILSCNSISIKVCDYFDQTKNQKIIKLLRVVKEEIRNVNKNNAIIHPFYKWEINEKGQHHVRNYVNGN